MFKFLVSISLSGSMSILSFSIQPSLTGKEIYETKCIRCHGAEGIKGKWGATNLQTSRLDDKETIQIIQNGKRNMPSFKKKLSEEQINAVKEYVKSLRK